MEQMIASLIQLKNRVRNRCNISRSLYFGRRMVELRPKFPIVSFTFDDFPRSALQTGGAILKRNQACGTYYVSLGLMNQMIPAGKAFSRQDLEEALDEGNELGCHTYGHCHAWNTKPSDFEESVIENRRTLDELFPGLVFRTLSYPVACPHPKTKKIVGKYFDCCRGGGWSHSDGPAGSITSNPLFNFGMVDVNNLHTFFLEKNCENAKVVKNLIDMNCRVNGWLIFATHDVCEVPTALGCSPAFFEEVVQHALAAGAKVLPVAQAWETITCRGSDVRSHVQRSERASAAQIPAG